MALLSSPPPCVPPPPPPAPPVLAPLPSQREEGVRSTEQVKVRWLGFLFWETLALLIFQLAAGFFANSLTLLADSGHSGADVVCYAINFLIERRKTSAGVSLSGRADVASTANSTRIDLVGCGLSTVLLCVATWLASVDAVDRLQLGKPEGRGDGFRDVGLALLAFAVVSTAANIGTLFVYHRWQVAAATRRDSARNAPASIQPRVDTVPHAPFEFDAPRRNRRGARNNDLNLCGNFSSPCASSSSSPSSALSGCKNAACCPKEDDNLQDAGLVAKWSSRLHFLVHPGCSGEHESGGMDQNSSDTLDTAAPREANLNFSSAMLHLVADVLRSVTILIVAIVIELGQVSEPGRVDAMCALLVAVFVALGSLALFQRLCSTWRKLRLGQPGAPPAVAMSANV